MTEKKIVRYGIPNVRGDDWEGKEEYRIDLPEIMKDETLGDYEWVKIELKDDATPPYVHGVKTENKGTQMEGYYSIKDGHLTIPKRWKDLFDKSVNYVGMEFYPEEKPSFRIYTFPDFALYRVPTHMDRGWELRQVKPAAIPAVWKSLETGSGPLDVASHSPYSGQRIRVIPFDANHQIFQENISGPVTEAMKVRRLLKQDSFTTNQIPRCQPDELTIEWDPSGRISKDQYPIFSTQAAEEIEIIIPENGYFSFSTSTQSGTESTWIEYNEGDGGRSLETSTIIGWGGHSIEQTEDGYLELFVPCQTNS